MKRFQSYHGCLLRQNKADSENFPSIKESLIQSTLRCHYQCIIWNHKTKVCLSKQKRSWRKLQTGFTFQSWLIYHQHQIISGHNPTNTPRGFHVERTWERSFPRRFKVESTWCVCCEAMSKTRFFYFRLVMSLYKNQFFDLQCKSMGWFLWNRNLHWEFFFFCAFTISPPNKCWALKAPHLSLSTLKDAPLF